MVSSLDYNLLLCVSDSPFFTLALILFSCMPMAVGVTRESVDFIYSQSRYYLFSTLSMVTMSLSFITACLNPVGLLF